MMQTMPQFCCAACLSKAAPVIGDPVEPWPVPGISTDAGLKSQAVTQAEGLVSLGMPVVVFARPVVDSQAPVGGFFRVRSAPGPLGGHLKRWNAGLVSERFDAAMMRVLQDTHV